MNRILKESIIFAGGLGIGTAIGVFVSKVLLDKKYSKMYEDAISGMEEYYGRTDEFKKEQVFEDDGLINPVSDEAAAQQQKLAEIHDKLIRNYEGTSNYAQLNREAMEAKKDDSETDDEGEDDEMDELTRSGMEIAIERADNINKPPEEISAEEYIDLSHNGVESAYFDYYRYDKNLIDEDENIIPNPVPFIGDALLRFDDEEGGGQSIFVRNYQLDTVYEICIHDA